MNIPRSEQIAAYSHGATVPLIVAGTLLLLTIASGDIVAQLVCLLYGLSGVFLFSASFFYHANKLVENDASFLRKLDHTAIFFLIAGTYTPVCFLYLQGTMKWSILIAQWSLVVAGIFFKFFYIKAPRIVGTLIYVLMGWIVLIPIVTLIETMEPPALILLILGGLSYTVGALIYALKKPNPVPGYFGFHEIFHLFVTAGALFHLAMVVYGFKVYSAAQ